MEPELRESFNRAWSPALYRRVKGDLERRVTIPIPFRVAETPVFLGPGLHRRFADAAEAIVGALQEPAAIARSRDTVPAAFRGAGDDALPQCVQVDFAVARDEHGDLTPRLIELQGFPSLYAFQILLADVWATHLAEIPGLPKAWRLFYGGLDRYHAIALLRRTLLGDHEPEHVVMLDYKPTAQKTYPDFVMTRHWFGIESVCLTELVRDGRRLYRDRDGVRVPVRRIYHRIVFDELERAQGVLPFGLGDVDVEWCPHPAWFYGWSKRSLLDLDHPSVPWTRTLDQLDELPDPLDGYVLKPLYSFAGTGVNVDPTPADVAAVPEEQRAGWVLQEKIEYAPAIRHVDGSGVKAELRMMFVRPDDEERPRLLLNLARLSRGKMMGVDYQDLDWTGASVAIWGERQ